MTREIGEHPCFTNFMSAAQNILKHYDPTDTARLDWLQGRTNWLMVSRIGSSDRPGETLRDVIDHSMHSTAASFDAASCESETLDAIAALRNTHAELTKKLDESRAETSRQMTAYYAAVREWRLQLLKAWASDSRAWMTALIEEGMPTPGNAQSL